MGTDLHRRRYSDWLIDQEASLTRRRDFINRSLIGAGVLVALLEALFPWQQYTPSVPGVLHILVAAILLPLLYFLLQNDYRNKLVDFTSAMNDTTKRLIFIDPWLEPEQVALQASFQSSQLGPARQALDQVVRRAPTPSLRLRVSEYYRGLPSHMHEGDRMGMLSLMHPKTALSWLASAAMIWILLPGVGISIGAGSGLTLLPLLLPVFLVGGHYNSRFAYELALYNWLRLG
ncbi:MAG: hypothetical protein H7A35_01740 [Planctomycetales bacterium]|nr:hypothetical protein [bacterium]UNM08780.1 MAG: hypothetical protein H7A35_01740 [Planctomycetales bacterium]